MTIFEVLAPSPCLSCHRLGAPLCIACKAAIPIRPREVDIGFSGWAVANYEGIAADLINEVKERGRTQLLNWVVQQLDCVELPANAVLVAMPSGKRAWRTRGFIPAEELALRLARRRNLKITRGALQFRRENLDQVALTRQKRSENRQNTMTAVKLTAPIVIVDDIVTTGSSLREAKRALEAAGGMVHSFITFAQTVLKSSAART